MADTEASTESAKEKRRARYEANREEEIERNRIYRRERKARTAELQRLRYAKNKEKERERIYAYRRVHPEHNRADQHRRRAGGSWNAADIRRLMELQRYKCAYSFCRVSLKGKYHVDHILPLALGGTNDPGNLQLLCVPCNQSKAARHPIDFAQMKGLLL